MLASTPATILTELQRRGVRFQVADGRLRWTPREAVQADEVELLRRFKPDLIRLLNHADDQPAASDLSAIATTTRPPDESWHVWLCEALFERTGQTWHATTPLVLADDDHRGSDSR